MDDVKKCPICDAPLVCDACHTLMSPDDLSVAALAYGAA